MINRPAAKPEDKIDLNLTTNIYRNGVPVARDHRFSVVRPGESLTGHVQITSKTAVHLDKIEFNFQGFESKLKYLPVLSASEPRTIAPEPGIVKFLDMSHCPDISDVEYTANHKVVNTTVPFVFILPQGIERVEQDETSSCRRYPPSFRLRRSDFSAWSHVPLPVSFITYVLRCSVTYCVQVGQSQLAQTVDTLTTVEYIPDLETQPPIDASDSRDHYKLTEQQSISSRAYFGQPLGDAWVQTAEPKALEYTGPDASTTCHFNINFVPTRRNAQQCPIKGIAVHPVLIATSYRSVAKLTTMPTIDLASEDGPLQMHQDTIDLGKSWFQDVLWEFQPASNEQNSVHGEACGTWRTTLAVAVLPPLRLDPSFQSDFTALAYSLIFSVRLKGVNSRTMYLRCPLQVVYPLQAEIPDAPEPLLDAVGYTEQTIRDVPCCSMRVTESGMDEILPPYAK